MQWNNDYPNAPIGTQIAVKSTVDSASPFALTGTRVARAIVMPSGIMLIDIPVIIEPNEWKFETDEITITRQWTIWGGKSIVEPHHVPQVITGSNQENEEKASEIMDMIRKIINE